jgi:hypothetical protein
LIFKSFDQLAEYWSPEKMKSTIIKLTYESIKSSDQDLLELLKMFKTKGYFETEDQLCTYV